MEIENAFISLNCSEWAEFLTSHSKLIIIHFLDYTCCCCYCCHTQRKVQLEPSKICMSKQMFLHSNTRTQIVEYFLFLFLFFRGNLFCTVDILHEFENFKIMCSFWSNSYHWNLWLQILHTNRNIIVSRRPKWVYRRINISPKFKTNNHFCSSRLSGQCSR